jgi:hypothetical protein
MADSDVTRKLEIYRALYRLNRGFAILSRNLDWLTANRVLVQQIPSDSPEIYESQLEEVQAAINRRLTEALHNLEHGDVRRLGRFVELAPHFRELHLAEYRKAEKQTRKKKALK